MRAPGRGPLFLLIGALALAAVVATSANVTPDWEFSFYNAKGMGRVNQDGSLLLQGQGLPVFTSMETAVAALRKVTGDVTITGRIPPPVGEGAGNPQAGFHARQDSAAGAPSVSLLGDGLDPNGNWRWVVRIAPNASPYEFSDIGPGPDVSADVLFRLQVRNDPANRNAIATPYMSDNKGNTWRPMEEPVTLPGPVGNAGTVIRAGPPLIPGPSERNLTANVTQVFPPDLSVQPGADLVSGLRVVVGGNGTVNVNWDAMAGDRYDIYQGPTANQLTKVNAAPIAGGSFPISLGEQRASGSWIIAVGRRFGDLDEPPSDPSLVFRDLFLPKGLPSGLQATDIGSLLPGSFTTTAAGTASVSRPVARTTATSAATGEFRVQGSGWGGAMGDRSRSQANDQGYFVSQPVTGNFRARVTALTRPTATHPWARGVLMMREKLTSTSRYIALGPTAQQGLYISSRLGEIPSPGTIAWGRTLDPAALTLPVVLQITRTRDPVGGDQVIERAYSTDGGRTFVQASRLRRQTYAETVNIGVMVSSNDRGRLTEMRFTGFEVQPL